MKRLLLCLPILLASCAASPQTTVDPVLYETVSSLSTLGVMGKAMSQSPDILKAIQGDQPVTVLLLRDQTLEGLMRSKNTTAQTYFASSEGQTFLKNHLVTSSIFGSGTFTSLGGLIWTVDPDTVPPYGPFVVNGKDSEGCYQTVSSASPAGHLDALCWIKGDITAGK